MYVMKLSVPCKDYIRGGTRLRDEYGKKSDADKTTESWELVTEKLAALLSGLKLLFVKPKRVM